MQPHLVIGLWITPLPTTLKECSCNVHSSIIKLVKGKMETWVFLDPARKVSLWIGFSLLVLLGLTYLVLAFQGLYPCVHLWSHISSWELTESPAPGRVLHGGGRAVLYWKPPRHHAGRHLQVFMQNQCPNFLLLPQLCSLASSWGHSFSLHAWAKEGLHRHIPKFRVWSAEVWPPRGLGREGIRKNRGKSRNFLWMGGCI